MKDLSRLTDTQRDNLIAGTWWDPAGLSGRNNNPTKPVEVVGAPVPHQITGNLIVAVRRTVKRGEALPFSLAVATLVEKYAPRRIAVAPPEPAPEPQMTLPLDAPPWAARLMADVAFLVKEAKGRAATTS